MKKLRLILSVLCILALLLPCVTATASGETTVTKTLKVGKSWKGTVSYETPVVLKLKAGSAKKIYVVVEGKKAWVSVQRADNPEKKPAKEKTDSGTNRVVVPLKVKTSEYLITLGALKSKKETKVSVTFLDEEAYRAQESGSRAPEATEPPAAERAAAEPAAETAGAESGIPDPGEEADKAALKAPVISKITQNNAGVTITWKKVSGAQKYEVYVKKDGDSKWSKAGTVTGETTFTHKNKITSKTSGRYDRYRVRAINKKGKKSEYSAGKKIWRLVSPGSVKLTNTPTKKKNGVTVSWGKVKGAEKYEVYYRAAGESSYTKKAVSGTSVTLSMTGGTEYSVHVLAKGKDAKSQKSSEARITPPRYFALVIGNGTGYRYLKPLTGVANDTKAMKKALGQTCQNWRITVCENRTAAQIKTDILSAFKEATLPTDVCLFFYSGHGDETKNSSAGSLCGIDYSYGTGAVSPAALRDTLNKATKGKVIVILDSCGSGASIYANGNAPANGNPAAFTSAVIGAFSNTGDISVVSNTGELRTSKYTVLAACRYGQTSMGAYLTRSSMKDWYNNLSDSPFLSGSMFTYSLVRSMGCSFPGGTFSGKISGDSNKDGWLSLKEAYSGIKSHISEMKKIVREYDLDPEDIFDQAVQMYGSSGFGLFAY